MKRIIFLLILIINGLSMKAQVAYWAIHPTYDSIKIMRDGMFMVSKEGGYDIINKEGKDLIKTPCDSIGDFRNGSAICYNDKNKTIVGFINEDGKAQVLPNDIYSVDSVCPFFREGFLVINGNGNSFFLNQSNGEIYGPYLHAFPCNEGYASVITKQDDSGRSTWALFSEEIQKTISFGQDINPNDIAFVSSVTNGKAIVVIKKRFYEYDVKSQVLTNLTIDGTFEKKSLVVAESRNLMIANTDYGWRVVAKNATFDFDNMLRLKCRQYAGKPLESFEVKEESMPTVSSKIQAYKAPGSDLVGIQYNDNKILPPQFEYIAQTYGNMAVVKTNGKYGVLSVDEKGHFVFRLNDNKDIAFEHGYYNSSLVVTFPPYISPAKAKVECHTKECVLKSETRKDNQNIETSSIIYDCQLTMNDDISEEAKPVAYVFSVVYDGLKSTDYPVTLEERFIKGYEVEITRESFKNQVAEIGFDVKPLNPNAGRFQKEVEVEPQKDEQVVVVEQLGEDSYQARIYGLDSNIAMFDIIVTEDGCPSVTYPFLETLMVNSEKKETGKTVMKSRGTSVSKKRVKRAPRNKVKQDTPLFIPN